MVYASVGSNNNKTAADWQRCNYLNKLYEQNSNILREGHTNFSMKHWSCAYIFQLVVHYLSQSAAVLQLSMQFWIQDHVIKK
jgi:hypothetical protein